MRLISKFCVQHLNKYKLLERKQFLISIIRQSLVPLEEKVVDEQTGETFLHQLAIRCVKAKVIKVIQARAPLFTEMSLVATVQSIEVAFD